VAYGGDYAAAIQVGAILGEFLTIHGGVATGGMTGF
jgi:hypothetical protein